MKSSFLLLLAALILFSCQETETLETVMKKWEGKTIEFPDNKPVHIYTKDTTKYVINGNKPYKILLYVDSIGCTNCKLRLSVWKDYIEKIGSNVDFLFWFHPKKKEDELFSFLKIQRLKYPVYIDKDDKLNKLNKFPKNQMFHCFLLDKDNKVLLVGNPVFNHSLWDVYQHVVTGKIRLNNN
ncbi:MAG: hypothetical protein LBT50_11420 [Prevotellaceae bacterium]|jgi:hypothetical protein|nr:hypothetical protein [Prevotellaceae bacterium]